MNGDVTVNMDAPIDVVWDLVSDITRIGEFSPETFEAEWLDGATGPAVGARFRGHVKRNQKGPTYWSECLVTECEPEHIFGFAVVMQGKTLNNWRYELEPDGEGTSVTESFKLEPTMANKIYWAALGRLRLKTNIDGMRTTLERIKAVVEREHDMAEHHLDDTITHAYWDREVDVRLEIESGDVVVIECAEPIGQVTPTWTSEDFAAADPSLAHALSGAIYVKGANPGDTLEIDILKMEHKGWGWSGTIPEFGLLADDFDSAHLHHWELDGSICRFADGIEVPAEPFPGVIGVAPREHGRLDTFPPRSNGGNLDTRDLVGGSTAWLPVHAEGALFSIGDCHSAQGDGEVCGTGVESPMTATVRLTVRPDLDVVEFQARRRTTPALSESEVHITTAHGPDLYENARNVTRYMIEWLGKNRGLEPTDAYLLCSTAANLRISEIVDAPNWVVSLHFPLAIFR